MPLEINCANIEIIPYQPKYKEQVAKSLRKSFCVNEAFCVAAGVDKNHEAHQDLINCCLEETSDGITVIALDTENDQVAGVLFNKIQLRGERYSFEQFLFDEKCTTEEGKSFMRMMTVFNSKGNLFEKYNVNSIFEISILNVSPEYQRRGIAFKMTEYSVQLAMDLKNGKRLEVLHSSLRDRPPQILSSVLTSLYSQRVGKQLSFVEEYEESYEHFEVDGKKYIGVHSSCILMSNHLTPKREAV